MQTYTPSDHEGVSDTQGSHFAIIAAEDGVVVDYWPTVATTGHAANTKVTTPTLNKGQVWYVWTGKKDGEAGDLSGTRVVARDGKKIAVFQGCPHTNIPYQIRERDHIFSQAMPTAYWGNRFVLTASKERKKDIIRVLALYDNTRIFINGNLAHTFNFNSNPKQYFEFVIGENGDYAENGSCYVTTSCPCAVHLFMASHNFDGVSNGDPAMLWVNPIEQRIDQISFATYNSSNGTTQHYTNIVTDKPELMTLDGNSIASEFKKVDGYSEYSYAQVSLGTNATSHTLKSNGSTFIAHVYGFTVNESYGYSAGSATVGRQISINDIPFESGEKAKGIADAPTFCVEDSVVLYDLRDISGSIYRVFLDFGDGTNKDTTRVTSGTSEEEKEPFLVSIRHAYPAPGWYDARAIVYGEEFCTQPAFTDTIPIIFRVVRADTVIVAPEKHCLTIAQQDSIISNYGQSRLDSLITYGQRTILNPDAPCYEDKQLSLVTYGLETENTFDRTVRDGVEIDGHWYESSATVTWTMHNANRYRCDSLLTCNLTVITCLNIDVQNQPDLQVICPGENLELPYKKNKGNISAAYFTVPGLLQDEPVVFDDNMMNGTFILPTSTITKAGKYSGTLYIDDLYCDSIIVPVDFTVLYPSDIFKFKFNNVLAVYQNRDYDFTGYQWFCNGQPVEGGTESILYLGQGVTFEEGDEVFVLLTDKSGMTLPSCPQTLTDIQDYNPEQEEPAQAQKKIVNRRFMIQKGNEIYDIYGQKVE